MIRAVYPRWHGEHSIGCLKARKNHGLSPLARGTRAGVDKLARHVRFIPAGAGNTRAQDIRALGLPVYPRWRGEHERVGYRPELEDGLSPLARGTPGKRHTEGLRDRFIPAGAGNTQ